MGTANFLFNHRLNVVSGLSADEFDFESYNEGIDENDKLYEDDYESLRNILSLRTENFITDLKYRADELGSDRGVPPKSHRVNRLLIHSDMMLADDDRKYSDRNFGGTKLAEIWTETVFFGEVIRLEMAVVLRHGYYDGCSLDQYMELSMPDMAYAHFEDYGDGAPGEAVDYIIEEFDNYSVATKAQTMRYRLGIENRLRALEQVLWQRYEELIEPYCEEYRVSARFNNGETWYSKVAA
ncbi:hypothetical protein [Neisseria musculi]|uniref:Uncharacterized protein n=1 Tax=Neisseria musculi TaxID=1815583 RepID=A0A7H1M9J6_9NEIS|nr:hypothetical protein [Neisseria musculi]QNT58311.1 hypothetical protein H7A79_0754 [Neisseria musculi]